MESIIKDKELYILKYANSRAYLREINSNEYSYTFDIEKAKKFNLADLELLKKTEHLEIVEYEKEKYEAANEKYTLYVKAISMQENTDILKNDIVYINNCEKEHFFIELYEKYPNNKLLEEITRIIYINNKNSDLNKKEFDYDYKQQMNLLEKAFINKYICSEMIEETEEEEI